MEREWEFDAKLVRAIDGDTYEFAVDVGFKIHPHITVRIIGINAPEITGKTKVEGYLSKDYAENILVNAENIVIKTEKNKNDVQKKSFTRYLAQVFVDGVDLAELLVNEKFAVRT